MTDWTRIRFRSEMIHSFHLNNNCRHYRKSMSAFQWFSKHFSIHLFSLTHQEKGSTNIISFWTICWCMMILYAVRHLDSRKANNNFNNNDTQNLFEIVLIVAVRTQLSFLNEENKHIIVILIFLWPSSVRFVPVWFFAVFFSAFNWKKSKQ